MRKIGIDYGDARLGIAISDPTGLIASAFETYERKNIRTDIDYLKTLALQRQADAFVIGLPINMDGTTGDRVEKTKEFASKLKDSTGITVVFQDERLSTVQAERRMIEMNIKKHKQRELIDKLAAQIILQAYLDTHPE